MIDGNQILLVNFYPLVSTIAITQLSIRIEMTFIIKVHESVLTSCTFEACIADSRDTRKR